MTPLIELQKSMDTTLTGLGYSVFDYRPVEEHFPYIVIGEDAVTSSMTKTIPHYTVVSIVNVFSKYLGNKEIKSIMDAIISNINTNMAMNGWKISHSKVVSTAILNDTQPDVIHGLVSMMFEISKIV